MATTANGTDIAVIGGGAAGMLAAAAAAETGAGVLLLERNKEPGRKLRLTGKGRCNLTNNCPVSEVIENIPTGGQFLHSALNAFPPAAVMELFESLGVPLKTERGNRVFPCSGKSPDVVNALRRYMDRSGAAIKHSRITDIAIDNTGLSLSMQPWGKLTCRAVILATGGMSYPATGSTGDGYKMAQGLGHTITPIRGSLVPLETDGDICGQMQGLTLKNIRLSVFENKTAKPVYEDFGELLFTHFGISGPVVLSASAHMREFNKKKYYALIDFKPALDEKKLDTRILRDFQKYSNRSFVNALDDLLPKSCIPVIVSKSGISPETKVHSITRAQRFGLVRLLKAFRLDIAGPRPVQEAVITSGGVDLREINPKTMESKLIKGLFFAGEIIDADAYTGGFNLQIAWSTAFAAARAAAVYCAL